MMEKHSDVEMKGSIEEFCTCCYPNCVRVCVCVYVCVCMCVCVCVCEIQE